jgi:hypothetical protein
LRRFFCLAVIALLVCFSATVFADGIPEGNGSGNSSSGSSGNKPGGSSDWPPKTPAKGTFVPGAFAGTWYAFTGNTAFTLKLDQDEEIIKGAHYAVFDYGRKIDSSNGTVSIVGTVKGSVAYVEWKSGLGTESGRATIELQPGRPITLLWMMADPPKKVDPQASSDAPSEEPGSYIPRAAYLIRK